MEGKLKGNNLGKEVIMFRKFAVLGLLSVSVSVFSADCDLSFDPSSTVLKWKAFKFTEKTGVEGSFTKVEALESKSAKSVVLLAEGLKFSIDTASVHTNNPDRDAKISKFFFGTMKETSKITGNFRKVKLSGSSGTADLVLKMNGETKTVPVKFTVADNVKIELKGTVDLNLFRAQKSVDSLNKECNAQHIGKDGKSKLWNDVEISLNTVLK
ncbi:MAG TPA: YceI family protein, partial [Leptospiraceae bacterium]|nr:YceI family protein [Leptospiraceae bacterium]